MLMERRDTVFGYRLARAALSSSGMLPVGWLCTIRSATPLPAASESASNTSCPSCSTKEGAVSRNEEQHGDIVR
jgi:hypothetical protein